MPFEWIAAVRFLREGRMQSLLIIVGVGVGVAVIVFMSALLSGLQANLIKRTLSSQAHIVLLPPVGSASREPLGAGYSIAAGVTARAQACGWLVLPGDMPRVRPQTLQLMARAVGQGAAPIACAQHLGRAGHPLGLAAEMYNELSRLSGDQGLRRLLARYPSFPVETGDPGVLIDIDTREDLERLIAAEPAFSVRQPVPLGQVDQA